ncbi:glycosyltransferase [Parapedobacter sp. ISTM3]|uniref:glycosyltransferase n=1 Tax=Parapedobacter sp. ISTM3 TaxID=2800130 RepID=UPI001904153F|nr:glycosyltransferase [Parapedobacter sp. ISTM3]MBK1442549.1 glycosyltransferase [Parapedobacter sp. ISTM3]
MQLSIIIPVFNRPQEVRDLLESLTNQTDPDFEVLVVEDGSTDRCESEVDAFSTRLHIRYRYRENSGPGRARNAGSAFSSGDYLIFLDSDCVLPPHYVQTVRQSLSQDYSDAFGGPDRAREDFSPMQRAINYSMTSFFTTGGIRGGNERFEKFHPRSFNMGFSRIVFEKTGGFAAMRFGEDIDMSIRIIGMGFTTRLIKEAYVYHRRRTTLRRFFKQVYNSGVARINLYKRHPYSLRAVHFAPAAFTVGVALILVLAVLLSPYFLLLLGVHAAFIAADAGARNRNLFIGPLAVVTSYTQLIGYGLGFMHAFMARIIFGQQEFSMFQRSFYN